MELGVLGLFIAVLILCLATGFSIVYALLFGFLLFFLFGLLKGSSAKVLLKASLDSVKKVSTIIIVMLLIGALTASWRASGTVALLVSYASEVVTPQVCLFSTFLLNALLSTLIGTSFGTAATMGVVTMTMCVSMGVSPLWAGGAVLAGAFTGDRCSPVSTSAQLVCLVTSTDLYKNMALMVKTGWLPFTVSSLIYLAVGLFSDTKSASVDISSVLSREFVLNWYLLIPVFVMFGLVALKKDIKITIAASIAAASAVFMTVQGADWMSTAKMLVYGYQCRDAQAGSLMDGGGLVSMVQVSLIIMVSCTYAGLFEQTGLLKHIEGLVASLAARSGKYTAIVFTAFLTAAISCNQMLAVILTEQLCKKIEPDRQKMAISLEDTAIVIPPLLPWSIAGAVPVATIGAPQACVVTALFLFLLPIFGIIRHSFSRISGSTSCR